MQWYNYTLLLLLSLLCCCLRCGFTLDTVSGKRSNGSVSEVGQNEKNFTVSGKLVLYLNLINLFLFRVGFYIYKFVSDNCIIYFFLSSYQLE